MLQTLRSLSACLSSNNIEEKSKERLTIAVLGFAQAGESLVRQPSQKTNDSFTFSETVS